MSVLFFQEDKIQQQKGESSSRTDLVLPIVNSFTEDVSLVCCHASPLNLVIIDGLICSPLVH